MAKDQYTQRDPRSQYPRPEQLAGQEQRYPGSTGEMGPEPDHGERTYRGSGRLTDRAAVITGGDSGIGRAVAVAFAHEGADVLLSYLDEEEADAKETMEWVTQAGRRAVALPGDIRDEAHCRRVIERAVEEFGRIDVLVNNAAYQMAQPDGILGISTEQFDRVLKTNCWRPRETALGRPVRCPVAVVRVAR